MASSSADSTFGLAPKELATTLLSATSTKGLSDLLARLPIVPEDQYAFDRDHPEKGWQQGKLHWYPVGSDRGNAGRIKLAGFPENPIAERTVNAMEALIELERQRELKRDANAAAPSSPRKAVARYFELPPLDELPAHAGLIRGQKAAKYARELARRIKVRLLREKRPVEYTVILEDEGIGQGPEKMHSRLLSLGSSDKGDKPYLIGVFGQGGSSAYQASKMSWLVSRRVADLRDDHGDGYGWTIVCNIRPHGRRDHYYAYLAAHPDGRVPVLPAEVEAEMGFKHGTRIAHVAFDFGKMEPARTLYPALNHLLFNPVLPYELYTKGPGEGADPMWGNGYRLSRQSAKQELALDKTFQPQAIERKGADK